MNKKEFNIKYEAPKTLEEAFTRKEKLGADIEQIQSQLGNRPNDQEWRSKAKIALLCKTEELRRIKSYIRENKTEVYTELSYSRVLLEQLKSTLKVAMEVLSSLHEKGIDIGEQGKFLLASYWLFNNDERTIVGNSVDEGAKKPDDGSATR